MIGYSFGCITSLYLFTLLVITVAMLLTFEYTNFLAVFHLSFPLKLLLALNFNHSRDTIDD